MGTHPIFESDFDCLTEMTSEKRQQFGNRLLNDETKVFEHNSWDRVEWTEEQATEAKSQIEKQLARAGDVASKYSVACEALSANWDAFYTNHSTKFFKDRAWLFTEFPKLDPKVCSEQVVLEVGCGNGSNILPLIEASREMEGYRLYGCDFAPKSVELKAASRVTIFEHDISSDQPLP